LLPGSRERRVARALSHDGHAELTSLDISNNHFERLPPLLTTLLDLKHLNIRGNSIPNARDQVGSWAQFRCRSTRLRAGHSRAHKCDPLILRAATGYCRRRSSRSCSAVRWCTSGPLHKSRRCVGAAVALSLLRPRCQGSHSASQAAGAPSRDRRRASRASHCAQ